LFQNQKVNYKKQINNLNILKGNIMEKMILVLIAFFTAYSSMFSAEINGYDDMLFLGADSVEVERYIDSIGYVERKANGKGVLLFKDVNIKYANSERTSIILRFEDKKLKMINLLVSFHTKYDMKKMTNSINERFNEKYGQYLDTFSNNVAKDYPVIDGQSENERKTRSYIYSYTTRWLGENEYCGKSQLTITVTEGSILHSWECDFRNFDR
jgi:hypothetical protein